MKQETAAKPQEPILHKLKILLISYDFNIIIGNSNEREKEGQVAANAHELLLSGFKKSGHTIIRHPSSTSTKSRHILTLIMELLMVHGSTQTVQN